MYSDVLTKPCVPPLCLSHLPDFMRPTHNHPLLCAPFRPPPNCAYPHPIAPSSLFIQFHLHLFFSSCFLLVQCVLEEMAGREAELGGLRERAHRLWEGQAAGKGFVHRVSQLSAQYLALSNLTKVTPGLYAPFLSLY